MLVLPVLGTYLILLTIFLVCNLQFFLSDVHWNICCNFDSLVINLPYPCMYPSWKSVLIFFWNELLNKLHMKNIHNFFCGEVV